MSSGKAVPCADDSIGSSAGSGDIFNFQGRNARTDSPFAAEDEPISCIRTRDTVEGEELDLTGSGRLAPHESLKAGAQVIRYN